MDFRMRASDADRERVVATLSEQVGIGRLTLEEFSERSATAYRSRTLGELDALTRDLPAQAGAPSRALRSTLPPAIAAVLVFALAVLLGGTVVVLTHLAGMGSMSQMMDGMMGH